MQWVKGLKSQILICIKIVWIHNSNKGTVSWDFLPLVFSSASLLGPLFHSLKCFRIWLQIRQDIKIRSDSPLLTTSFSITYCRVSIITLTVDSLASCKSTTDQTYKMYVLAESREYIVAKCSPEAIFTNSSRTKFAKCFLTYSYLSGRVGGGGGGRRASLLLPPSPLPCRTLYCTSVQFTNFVRELLVNIASGDKKHEPSVTKFAILKNVKKKIFFSLYSFRPLYLC